jgi:hypothetical protein
VTVSAVFRLCELNHVVLSHLFHVMNDFDGYCWACLVFVPLFIAFFWILATFGPN